MTAKMVRQGDVLFIPVTVKASEVEDAHRDPRGLVLAEGESSGHYHALFGPGAKLMRFKDTGQLVAKVGRLGEVRVVGGEVAGTPRHTTMRLTSGTYKTVTQRSWTSAQRNQAVHD